MIQPDKLFQLSGGQKRRKLALTFGALERDIAGIAEKGTEYAFKSMSRADYTRKLIEMLLQDPKLPPAASKELKNALLESPFDERRACNVAKNHLLAMLGSFPAEWDLVIAPHAVSGSANENGDGVVFKRTFYEGVCVYAEDIRSPFNVGSIFRTAEGMGAEKVYVSPSCVPPEHPRAVRSGMGCIETMGYERLPLEDLPSDIPIFALETGGTAIDEFVFPRKGICIIGSEELGLSPQALRRATYGRVTIPMIGLKASLNVGVAFGILMQKWVEQLKSTRSDTKRQDINPSCKL